MEYKKILLVDDDREDAEIFVMALHAINTNIKCVVEHNALEALKKLTLGKKLPDIIFLDYYMPYLDGGEFLKLLREVKGLQKIPVILYSGHSDETTNELIKNSKNLDFVKKPDDFKDIIKTLQKIIGHDSQILK